MNNLILLTGSNGGIGGHVAEYLIDSGIKNIVFQVHKNQDNIKAILEKNDMPFEKHLFTANLTSEDELKSLSEQIYKKWENTPSILLNIAGGSKNSMSWKMTKQDFQDVIDQNLLSTFLTCREFIAQMREKRFGRIINIASVVAFTGVAGASHYCAAKAGIIGLSKSLSHELINKDITVNTLALGYFSTGIIDEVPEKMQEIIKSNIPAKKFGDARQIGSLIKFLISSEAEYITGQVHHINGGLY